MATSSILGIDSDNLPPAHSATGIDSLGPSDASDSGSDSAGAYGPESDSDTDRYGTGERSSVDLEPQAEAQDILPDHVETLDAAEPVDEDLPAEAGMQDQQDNTAGAPGGKERRATQRSGEAHMLPDDLPAQGDADSDDVEDPDRAA